MYILESKYKRGLFIFSFMDLFLPSNKCVMLQFRLTRTLLFTNLRIRERP